MTETEQMERIYEKHIASVERRAAGFPPLDVEGEPIKKAIPTEEQKIKAAEYLKSIKEKPAE